MLRAIHPSPTRSGCPATSAPQQSWNTGVAKTLKSLKNAWFLHLGAEVQEFEDEKTQVDFRFDKFFFKYYFLLVFTLISINRKRKQLEILLRNSISKKFRQIENQLGFFHPWIPAPLSRSFRWFGEYFLRGISYIFRVIILVMNLSPLHCW